MSCFLVLDTDTEGRLIGLVDDYGRCHLARISTGAGTAIGSQLHGPRPAVGRHFLVSGHTGHRLHADFEVVGVSRQAMLDQLHPHRH